MKKIVSFILSFAFITAFAQESIEEINAFKAEGNTAYKAKDYANAHENYKKAVELSDAEGITDTALIYNTGYTAYKAKMYEDVLPFMQRSSEFGYKDDLPYQILAACYIKLDDNKKLEEVTREGLEKYPDSKKLKGLLSRSLLMQGLVYYKEGNAIKKAANESGLNTTDPEAFKAEYEKADAEYNKALPFMLEAYENDPKSKNVLKVLVNIYTNLDNQEEVARYKSELEALSE